MPHFFRRTCVALVAAGWAAAVAVGGARLWTYDGTPGEAALSPVTWPADARVTRDPQLPTVVVSLHPRCPCSRATVGELAKLMTDCQGKLAATVLVVRPAGMPAGWEQTDLWTSAASIPGVRVVADEQGQTARLFGAATSGQALLYAADGRLLFAGGITESRGHSGDNAGRSAIVSLVRDEHRGGIAPSPVAAVTPVYGCSLFARRDGCQNEEGGPCPR